MTNLTQKITKGALGTVAAGAMALASASPAMAGERHRDRDGIDAGDVIAGALIIGGIAAIAGAIDNDRGDRRYRDRHYRGNGSYDRRHYGNGYSHGYYGRQGAERAVRRCIRAAERQARRFGGYNYANVTQIRDVDRTRYGFRIRGRIEVDGQRGYRHGYNGRDYDRGRFTCHFDRGSRRRSISAGSAAFKKFSSPWR